MAVAHQIRADLEHVVVRLSRAIDTLAVHYDDWASLCCPVGREQKPAVERNRIHATGEIHRLVGQSVLLRKEAKGLSFGLGERKGYVAADRAVCHGKETEHDRNTGEHAPGTNSARVCLARLRGGLRCG